ncbi:hypothetical protein ABZP36_001743 [Zizania latifolia]
MRLPWFHGPKVASADDGRAAVPAGKGPPEKGGAGVARRASAAVVRGLVDKAGKAFARSIPAARFGHLAYISGICVRVLAIGYRPQDNTAGVHSYLWHHLMNPAKLITSEVQSKFPVAATATVISLSLTSLEEAPPIIGVAHSFPVQTSDLLSSLNSEAVIGGDPETVGGVSSLTIGPNGI